MNKILIGSSIFVCICIAIIGASIAVENQFNISNGMTRQRLCTFAFSINYNKQTTLLSNYLQKNKKDFWVGTSAKVYLFGRLQADFCVHYKYAHVGGILNIYSNLCNELHIQEAEKTNIAYTVCKLMKDEGGSGKALDYTIDLYHRFTGGIRAVRP